MNKVISKPDNTANQFSEGEEFLKDFFHSEDIRFEFQKPLLKLKGDNRAYRVADFFLPKFGVYIEFLGMWNVSEDKRSEYREKKTVYENNNIPCIYLYPENLGIIHYVFNKRLRAVLSKHNLKKELFKHNLKLFLGREGALFFWLILALSVIFFNLFDNKPGVNWKFVIGPGIGAGYLVYLIKKGYNKYFKDGYSYVDFMKV